MNAQKSLWFDDSVSLMEFIAKANRMQLENLTEANIRIILEPRMINLPIPKLACYIKKVL